MERREHRKAWTDRKKRGLKQTQLNILHPFKTKKKKKRHFQHILVVCYNLCTHPVPFSKCVGNDFFFFPLSFFQKPLEGACSPSPKLLGHEYLWLNRYMVCSKTDAWKLFFKKIWQKSCRTLGEEGTDMILADV